MKNLGDIKAAQFLPIYADEAENALHREKFSIFLTNISETMECLKTIFFGILKLEKTNAADIMALMKKFFVVKGVNVEKFLFNVLDGTNTMMENGLQRRI